VRRVGDPAAVDGIDAQSGGIPECREDNNDALNVDGMCVIPT